MCVRVCFFMPVGGGMKRTGGGDFVLAAEMKNKNDAKQR